MEHMAAFAFVEPEDSLAPEHLLGHLVVEEVLELAQCKGPITLERQGGEALDVLMVVVAMAMAVVMVYVVMAVRMTVIVMIVPVAVIVPMTVIVPMAWIVCGGTHLV